MRVPIYGLDKELANYDYARENEARAWIETVSGEKLNGATFQESLKDGIILCKLVNKCVPGSAIRPTESKMPFKQMENISAFLTILETIGVVSSIFALSRACTKKGYDIPLLGAKLADAHHVEFTEKQLNEGKFVINELQMGSNKGANASGLNFGARREIGGTDPGKLGKH